MKKVILFLSLLTATTVWAADMAKITKAIGTYDAEGKKLMTMITAGKVDTAAAEKIVTEMTGQAKIIVEEFGKHDKKATGLMTAVVGEMGKMKTMTFEDLESQIHDGGAFPAAKYGIDLMKEENEKYTDPIHSLVHPFMTLAAIKKNDLKAAKEELAEGIEQMNKSKDLFK